MEAVFLQALPGHRNQREEGRRGHGAKRLTVLLREAEHRKRELTTGIENGPLCPAALQRAPLAVRTHHTDVTLTLFSVDSRSSRPT